MSVDAIMEAIDALSQEDRETFFTRLDERYPVPFLSPELKQLLDERVAAADVNPGVGYTMEEVIAYVKRKK